MARRTVELRIAGQTYRVVSSASDEELHRLAGVVSRALRDLAPAARAVGRTPEGSGRIQHVGSQGMLLAAMALAHEAEEERARRVAGEQRTRELLGRLLERIERALGPQPEPVVAHGD